MAASMKSVCQMFGPHIYGQKSFLNPRCIVSLAQRWCHSHTRYYGQPTPCTHPHLIQEGEVTPGVCKTEYKKRRSHLMNRIFEKSKTNSNLVIIPAASKVNMTYDIPYVYRQNSEFLYLSGFQEPDSTLIVHGNKGTSDLQHMSLLFVPKRDPTKELWDGPRSGKDGAMHVTGIDKAYNMEDLNNWLYSYLTQNDEFSLWYDYHAPVHSVIHNHVVEDFVKETKLVHLESPRSLIHSLRLIKSPMEIDLMRKSAEISAQAFIEVMKYSHPQVNEAHLFAKMDYECRLRGSEFLAYPPVVAGGNRSNTIHYINNNQLVRDGELVLMDAGGEYHGYASDITRTWPVSGKFSPVQREVYNAVLRVQEKCIDLCGNFLSLERIFLEMLKYIGEELKTLGIVPRGIHGAELQRRAREICPHHVSHYLGMDVHDTSDMPRNIPLQPGMVVTIEPGMYFPESSMNIPDELKGIGIRIEDDVLITEDGPEVLTASCPKKPEDIERIMATK